MSYIRKFFLQNAAGERFDITDVQHAYLTHPEGLGFELDPPLADLGNGFFSELDDLAEPQGILACTLVFVPPAYQGYRAFADWLAAAGELLLIYAPYSGAEFQRRVSVSYLQKGELDKTRLLTCPLGLTCLSPWRLPQPTEISLVTGSGANRARYSGRYPGRYGSDAAGNMAARIAAAGHLPGAVLLRYQGAVTDPEIRLTGARSGKVYGICRLSGVTLTASDVLELSTLREDSHVRKIAADGSVTDLLASLDLRVDPFPRVPVDEDSILAVTSAEPFTGAAELLVYAYYRTV